MIAAPGIDHRQHLNPAGRASLGIFANTVNAQKTKTEHKTDDSAVQGGAARYQLQRAAQGLLRGERVEHCQRSTMSSAGVSVYRSAKGASYRNLSTCGSVWHCPVCAAKITEKRRIKLQESITAWALSKREVYLLSLTFPHLDHQPLDENLRLFSLALKRFKNSRAYKNVLKAVGSPGSIRALEVTHGDNGWHPHTHDLLFADRGQLDKLKALDEEWINSIIAVGLSDRAHYNDMKAVAFDVQNGDYAAEYVAKFGHEAAEASKIITGNVWGASHELTKGYAKVGKRLGGDTPFTLLARFIQGDQTKDFGALFQDFGKQFKGKRQLFKSPKLVDELEALGVARDNQTDEEVAAAEEIDEEFVTMLTHENWRLVLSRNARYELLRVAQDEGAEGVERLLRELSGRRYSHSDNYHERGRKGWNRLGGFIGGKASV